VQTKALPSAAVVLEAVDQPWEDTKQLAVPRMYDVQSTSSATEI
jgi:hypothetical protein